MYLSSFSFLQSGDRIKGSGPEKTLLKNHGSWLGQLTLARNKPILFKKLDMKVAHSFRRWLSLYLSFFFELHYLLDFSFFRLFFVILFRQGLLVRSYEEGKLIGAVIFAVRVLDSCRLSKVIEFFCMLCIFPSTLFFVWKVQNFMKWVLDGWNCMAFWWISTWK